MHNIDVDAVEQTAAKAVSDPSAVSQHISFDGEWQTCGPQFRATVPVPNGEPVVFEADFPPPMGALGVSDQPPVDHIDWQLDVDADAPAEVLDELKRAADDHCPGAYCIRNPIDLRTSITVTQSANSH
jgi:hypothetical protein